LVGWGNYGAGAGVDLATGHPVFMANLNLLGIPILQSLTKVHLKQK